MIVLGIDPGTATIGFGVVEKTKIAKKIKVADYGCIKTDPKMTVGKRLEKLSEGIEKLIKIHRPDLLAIENLYFFKNIKTALPVSQAKGVILLMAEKSKVPVQEFTPPQVKMTITGYGKAEKKQVQKMVGIVLGLKEAIKSDDAADALGVAICGCLFLENKIKIKKALLLAK